MSRTGPLLAGRYELLSEIGRGGMGVVYRARDCHLSRDVAVKVLPEATPEFAERFLREARVVARFDHPGIVTVHDAGKDGDRLFFVMPIVPGTSLRAPIAEGSLSRREILEVGAQVAEALAHAHSFGVVHRDVKPENVMLAREAPGIVRARLMDFGLALESSEPAITRPGTICGTVSYMSPEQVRGERVDEKSDVWALATLLYECLAGRPPFSGDVRSVLFRIVNEATRAPEGVEGPLASLLLDGLAKDPPARPDARAFAAALRRVAGVAPRPESAQVTAALARETPRLFGRERELSALLSAVDSARGARLVLVEGEDGAGKSALLDELERRLRGSAAVVRLAHPERAAASLRRAAEKGPAVALLEDLHAGDRSAEGVRELVDDLAGARVVVVATWRRIGLPRSHALVALARERDVVSLEVRRLPLVEYEFLVAGFVGHRAAFAGELYEAAGGNPLLTRGLLEARRDHEELSFTLPPELPASLADAFAPLLDRLSDEERRLLQVASVAGEVFDLELVEDAGGLGPVRDELVEELKERALLVERRDLPGDRYEFSSVPLRLALYASVPRRRRRQLHRAFAESLEAGEPFDAARHFACAEVPEKAAALGRTAAAGLLDAGESECAARAAKLAERFAGSDSERAEAKRLLSRALRASGEASGAALQASEAARLLEACRSADAAEACLEAAERAWDVRRSEDVRRWIERGLAARGSTPELHARLQRLASTVEGVGGQYAAATTAAASGARREEPGPSHVARGAVQVAVYASVTHLDPGRVERTAEAEAAQGIFETLARVGPDAHVGPWLASELAMDSSSLRLRLRDGITFHDGRPLTSADVLWTFQRLARVAPKEFERNFWAVRPTDDPLPGFRAVNDSEIRIELREPCPALPARLSNITLAIVPRGDDPDMRGDWRGGLVGTGPFRVVHFEPGSRLELERNPNYWRSGLPRTQGLVFHFGVAPDDAVDGFLRGDVNLLGELPPDRLSRLRSDRSLRSHFVESPTLSTAYVALNGRSEPLRDPEARRRVRGLIDRQRIVGAMGPDVTIASGLIPPGLPGHRPPGVQRKFAPAPLEPLEMELHVEVRSAYPRYLPVNAAVVEQLRAGGVRVHVHERENRPGRDVYVSRWLADFPDPDSFCTDLLHGEAGLLGQLCGSEALDALIAHARREIDPASRHAAYRRIEEHLEREALLVPLFYEMQWRIARPEVHGLDVGIFWPIVEFENLWIQG